MKRKLLMTVSALAIAAPLSAAGAAEDNGNYLILASNTDSSLGQAIESAADATAGAAVDSYEAVSSMFESSSATLRVDNYVLAPNAVTASYVIGADVRNPTNETIASIADIVIEQDGDAELLILSDGGFLGFADKKVAIPFENANLTFDEDGTRIVAVALTQAHLDQAKPFYYEVPEGTMENGAHLMASDHMSVDAIVGSDVKLSNKDESVAVADVLMDKDGESERAVLEVGGFLGLGERLVTVPFSALTIGENKDGYTIVATRADIEAAPTFAYTRASAGSSTQ